MTISDFEILLHSIGWGLSNEHSDEILTLVNDEGNPSLIQLNLNTEFNSKPLIQIIIGTDIQLLSTDFKGVIQYELNDLEPEVLKENECFRLVQYFDSVMDYSESITGSPAKEEMVGGARLEHGQFKVTYPALVFCTKDYLIQKDQVKTLKTEINEKNSNGRYLQ